MKNLKLFLIYFLVIVCLLFGFIKPVLATDWWQQAGDNIYNLNSGNVGIGTSNPLQTFHVFGASILGNLTTIDPDLYSNTVIAGWVADGSSAASLGVGGNAGTGDSWFLGHNGSVLSLGMQNSSSANTMQSYIQFYGNRNTILNPVSGNVGIDTTNPSAKLEVNGGVKLNTATSKPTCDSSQRGLMWFTIASGTAKDTLEVCAQAAGGTCSWRTLY